MYDCPHFYYLVYYNVVIKLILCTCHPVHCALRVSSSVPVIISLCWFLIFSFLCFDPIHTCSVVCLPPEHLFFLWFSNVGWMTLAIFSSLHALYSGNNYLIIIIIIIIILLLLILLVITINNFCLVLVQYLHLLTQFGFAPTLVLYPF